MKRLFSLVAVGIFGLSSAAAQTHVLEREEPVLLKAHKLENFELPMGTYFELVLEQANDIMPVALVSRDVHDFYGNVTVPRGSKVIGRYVGFKSGRHIVEWNSLQLANSGGTFRIDPPLLSTMADGTTGYVDYKPGWGVSAVVQREFVVPQ